MPFSVIGIGRLERNDLGNDGRLRTARLVAVGRD